MRLLFRLQFAFYIYVIKGHIIILLHFALSTSSFTVLILLNILYSYLLSGSGIRKMKKMKIKISHTYGLREKVSCVWLKN